MCHIISMIWHVTMAKTHIKTILSCTYFEFSSMEGTYILPGILCLFLCCSKWLVVVASLCCEMNLCQTLFHQWYRQVNSISMHVPYKVASLVHRFYFYLYLKIYVGNQKFTKWHNASYLKTHFPYLKSCQVGKTRILLKSVSRKILTSLCKMISFVYRRASFPYGSAGIFSAPICLAPRGQSIPVI